MASPLLAALRKRYPEARIAWLVQPESKDLLVCHPAVDELIVWPRGEWRQLAGQHRWFSLLREVLRFKRRLRGYGFDLAIDAQGLLKSGLLTWLSGARERIGLGSREGSRWLMTRVVDRGGDSKRIGSEYLHLARTMELPSDPFEMWIAPCDEDVRQAEAWMAQHGLQEGYLAICPFTTRPQKHWFAERWIELIPRLAARFGMPVVMLGGPGDRPAADEIAGAVESGLVDLVGETSLRQAAALIERCALLIGVDTGLSHMGIAFDRPTLCLFGSTCPYLDTTHDNARVIYHRLDCSPCKRHPTCDGRFDCMRAIGVDEVLDLAVQLHTLGEPV